MGRKDGVDFLDDSTAIIFDKIYSTDLVFIQDCWRLCGDAHCCNFNRYKSRFKLIAQTRAQELPLLPGEFEYLQNKGWLQQFGDFDHKVIEYSLDHRTLRVESIVSRRPNCACDHDTRPTVCRLYPLLPVFDIDGKVTGIDTFGIYEELEKMDDLEPACRITTLPLSELQKFLTICHEIGRCPLMLYYITAYRITKNHIFSRLNKARSGHHQTSFSLFEKSLIRNLLIDHPELKHQLASVADTFKRRYRGAFLLQT